MILPSKYELDAIDMETISRDFKPCPEIEFLKEPAGMNHYRLLKWIGENIHYPEHPFKNNILELGTYMGLSSACLAYGGMNVHTCDINFDALKFKSKPDRIKTHLIKSDNESPIPHYLYLAPIIFVDTYHLGVMEKRVFEICLACTGASPKWRGILIFDDIYYNDEMKEFWSSVPDDSRYNKIDATDIGHVTGTGIIEFI